MGALLRNLRKEFDFFWPFFVVVLHVLSGFGLDSIWLDGRGLKKFKNIFLFFWLKHNDFTAGFTSDFGDFFGILLFFFVDLRFPVAHLRICTSGTNFDGAFLFLGRFCIVDLLDRTRQILLETARKSNNFLFKTCYPGVFFFKLKIIKCADHPL